MRGELAVEFGEYATASDFMVVVAQCCLVASTALSHSRPTRAGIKANAHLGQVEGERGDRCHVQ